MTSVLASVSQCVRFWRRGRVVLPLHRFRGNSGGFGGGFGVAGGQGRGWLEVKNLMQVKFRAAFLPPESLLRRAKPAAMGYYEEYEKESKYEQLKKSGVNRAFR